MRLTLTWFLLAASASFAADRGVSSNCRQCLVITTDSWTATRGELMAFERTKGGAWHHHKSWVPVNVGKAGLAWGRGVADVSSFAGPTKREGDNKAPAGVFRLGTAFGYAHRASATRLSYLPLTKNVVGVDDPQSRYYNRLLDKSQVAHPDWRSAENMILTDDRYKWGVVVEHNIPPKPGAGSCIFLHVWKSPAMATTGCTAMPEAAMVDLIQWLDPAMHPELIQLPSPIYKGLRAKWTLPDRGI